MQLFFFIYSIHLENSFYYSNRGAIMFFRMHLGNKILHMTSSVITCKLFKLFGIVFLLIKLKSLRTFAL